MAEEVEIFVYKLRRAAIVNDDSLPVDEAVKRLRELESGHAHD